MIDRVGWQLCFSICDFFGLHSISRVE